MQADQNGFLQIQNQIEGQLNHMLYNAGDFGFFSRSKGGSKRQLNHKYKMQKVLDSSPDLFIIGSMIYTTGNNMFTTQIFSYSDFNFQPGK